MSPDAPPVAFRPIPGVRIASRSMQPGPRQDFHPLEKCASVAHRGHSVTAEGWRCHCLPQRGNVLQPRVALKSATLGTSMPRREQPQKGCVVRVRRMAATPLGLTRVCDRLPRVAASRQPWALGFYPFGVSNGTNGNSFAILRLSQYDHAFLMPRTVKALLQCHGCTLPI